MTRGSLLLGLALLSGCDVPDNDCSARGGATTFTGSASYTGQSVAGSALTPLTGSYAANVTVYDANENCYYDGMAFPVGIGSCLLWATLPSGGQDGGTDLAATIVPGQVCTLGLVSGAYTMNVTSGTLAIGEPTMVTLAGSISSGASGSGDAGSAAYLEWSFQGQ